MIVQTNKRIMHNFYKSTQHKTKENRIKHVSLTLKQNFLLLQFSCLSLTYSYVCFQQNSTEQYCEERNTFVSFRSRDCF